MSFNKNSRREKGSNKMSEVSKIEQKYPQTTKAFNEIYIEMYELFAKKQLDYGPQNISMGQSLETQEEIDFSLLALSIRMNDKLQRLMNLLRNNQKPNNESIEDTLIDLANYSVMALIVKKGRWAK